MTSENGVPGGLPGEVGGEMSKQEAWGQGGSTRRKPRPSVTKVCRHLQSNDKTKKRTPGGKHYFPGRNFSKNVRAGKTTNQHLIFSSTKQANSMRQYTRIDTTWEGEAVWGISMSTYEERATQNTRG